MVKESQNKHSRWVYGVLVLMLLALVGFSLLPIFSTISEPNQSLPAATVSLSDQQKRLKSEALGYQLVLEREPNNQTALKGLLETRLQQGEIAEAIEPLTKLAQLNPQQINYQILLAETRAYLDDFEGAAEVYGRVLASEPGNISALQGMVNLRLEQDLPEDAIALLKDTLNNATLLNSAQANTVDVVAVQLLLGQIYASQGSYAEAIAVYDQAVETDNEDFRPILAKALVLQEQGKELEAQPLFAAAIALAPLAYQEEIEKIAATPISKSK